MNRISKGFAVFIILIIVISILSLLIVKPAYAESISKPSVPQFTLKLIGTSEVQITIQNQPLVLTMNNESMYYNVRVKGHLENDWTELYTNNRPDLPILKGTIPMQSDSQATVLYYSISDYPQNTELDFQVIAMNGEYYSQEPASHDPLVPSQTVFGILADGESGWSGTQTITIPATSTSISPTPILPEFPSTILIILFLATATLLAMAVIMRKHSFWKITSAEELK